jgi:hypothetical protein
MTYDLTESIDVFTLGGQSNMSGRGGVRMKKKGGKEWDGDGGSAVCPGSPVTPFQDTPCPRLTNPPVSLCVPDISKSSNVAMQKQM